MPVGGFFLGAKRGLVWRLTYCEEGMSDVSCFLSNLFCVRVCGGGEHNVFLRENLAIHLINMQVADFHSKKSKSIIPN